MLFIKKTVAAGLVLSLGIGMSCVLFAESVQKKSSNSEKSVESEYLSDIDTEIISSLANSDEYDNKLVALQYLKEAVDGGNTSDGIVAALDKLAGDGISSQARTNGRVMNNFPDIRREACLLLGKVKTEHAKNTLVSIAVADNEPMVISAAVRSLGEIGINQNDEVIDAIAFANRRNEVLNPTSSLALEVLNAFETLSPTAENKKTMIDAIARIAVDYNYVTPVRQKAYKLLKQMSQSDSSSKDSKDSKDSKESNESKE
ncbi:MAG: HEAT repeat domain-containing protein [Treponema sp.]|nr:HEAT repeat domain-containing protein [Treponema sp.]